MWLCGCIIPFLSTFRFVSLLRKMDLSVLLRFLAFHTQERERSKIKLSQKVSQDFAQETMPYSPLLQGEPQSIMLG